MHIPLVLLIIDISAALASLCSSQPVKKNRFILCTYKRRAQMESIDNKQSSET